MSHCNILTFLRRKSAIEYEDNQCTCEDIDRALPENVCTETNVEQRRKQSRNHKLHIEESGRCILSLGIMSLDADI